MFTPILVFLRRFVFELSPCEADERTDERTGKTGTAAYWNDRTTKPLYWVPATGFKLIFEGVRYKEEE